MKLISIYIILISKLVVDGSKETQWNLVKTSRESYNSLPHLVISLIDLKLNGLSDDIQQSNKDIDVIQFFQKMISETHLKAAPLKPLGNSVYDKDNDLVSKVFSYAHASSTAECLECKHLLTKLEHDIGNDRSKIHIIAVMNQSCSSVPPKYKEQCFDFIKTHEDYIVESIQNQAAPKEICKGLGFCKVARNDKTISIEKCSKSKLMRKPEFVFSHEEIVSLELVEAELESKKFK